MPVFEQSILIQAAVECVDRCITDPLLMPQWLHPLLRCESVGDWSVEVGDRFRFIMQIPLLQPTLECVVTERRSGLVQWGFSGFFQGSDRWECVAQAEATLLVNRFSFAIPNPLVQVGFKLFAESLTRRDMQDQLRRVKAVAESLSTTNR